MFNPFKWIQSNLLWIVASVGSLMTAVIAILFKQKSDVQKDLAKGAADQLRHTIEAQREAEEEANELVQNAEARAKHGELRDLD